MKVKEMMKKLKQMNPDEEIASIIWTVEDVIESAIQHKVKITDAQAENVLRLCVSEHNAEIGINWDVIAFHIQQVTQK